MGYKLYNKDCLAVLLKMQAQSVALIVTSPPYNTGGKSLGYHPNSKTGDSFYANYADNLDEKQYKRVLFAVIQECIRVSRYTFWNMQVLAENKDTVIEIQYFFKEHLKDIFIWHKQAVSQIIKGRMAKGFEFVFCFGQDSDMTFEYNNFPKNGYVPNIQKWHKKESEPGHHAIFPYQLTDYFVEYFSKVGDLVLDPFVGTGRTGISCIKKGREFIGIDIDPSAIIIARKNLAGTTKQPALFIPEHVQGKMEI